jgi:glutaconyl-CoA decarboxylase
MRKFRINVNGNSYDVEVEELGGAAYAPAQAVKAAPVAAPAPAAPVVAATAPAPAEAPVKKAAAAAAEGTQIKSPMPGAILDVRVKEGDEVKKGDVLLILEAMKMENEIQAPSAGKVAGVYIDKGSSVNAGDLLVVIA